VYEAPWGSLIVGELELGEDGSLRDRPLDALGPGSDHLSPIGFETVDRKEWGKFLSPNEVERFLKAMGRWRLGAHRTVSRQGGNGREMMQGS